MPRRAHPGPHATYLHVLNRSARRRVLFEDSGDYRAFLMVLAEGLTRRPVRLIAYTLMPDHWHLVMGPTNTPAVSRCLHWVTATHAMRRHRGYLAGLAPVYQGRFTTMELPAIGDLLRVCRLVERDALQAGLVERAEDWPWCSLTERLRPVQEMPVVTTPFLSSPAWVDYVNAARPSDDVAEAPGRLS